MNNSSYNQNIEPPDDDNYEGEKNDPIPTIIQQAIMLQTQGLPITPYQQKVKSKLYYGIHKKRIDALFEVVQSEKRLVNAIREWWIEAWKLHNVEEEIKIAIKTPREIEKLKQEQELSELKDEELQKLNKEELILKKKVAIASLKRQLSEYEGGREKESDSEKIKKEAQITVEKAMAVFKILETVHAKEKEIKEKYDEEDAERITGWAKELLVNQNIL